MDQQKAERYRARYDEDGFQDYISELVEGGQLEGPALGIAKRVADKGVNSLTDKQRFVFERDVMDHYYVDECERCGNEIVWEEMYFAEDEGLCSYCSHMTDKMKDE